MPETIHGSVRSKIASIYFFMREQEAGLDKLLKDPCVACCLEIVDPTQKYTSVYLAPVNENPAGVISEGSGINHHQSDPSLPVFDPINGPTFL